MKNNPFLLPLLALLLLTAGCKKALGLLSFYVEDSASFSVPASPLPAGTVLMLPPLTVASTASTTFAANKTTADYVQDVTLDRLALAVTAPAGQNFDFLRRVEIYISDDAAGTNKTLLASLSPVPMGQTSITLTPSGNKFDGYLRGASYALFTTVELAQPLPQATTLRADARFKVKARLPD